MKPASGKAKGRRAAAEVKALLLKHAPDLHEMDIWITPSGVTGPDLGLSEAAYKKFNFAVESKNCESISIWAAYEQAKSHVRHFGSIAKNLAPVPILFFKRNRSDLMVTLSAEDFLKLIT